MEPMSDLLGSSPRREEPSTSILDSIPAILWVYAPELELFLYVNDAAERITGYPKERWLREPGFWSSIIHPDDRTATLKDCRSATRKLVDHTLDYRIVAASGASIWMHDVATVRKSDPVRLNGMMIDVTAQHDAAETGRAHEASFAAFLEHSPEMALIVEGGRVAYANAAATAKLGFNEDELIGRPFASLVEAGEREQVAAKLARMFVGERVETPLVMGARTKEGRPFEAEAYGDTVLWGGRRAVVIVARRDEVRRKELELKLVQADRMIALGTLAASVVHELSSPVANILLNLDFAVLELGRADPPALGELRGVLEESQKSAEHARQIIRDIRSLGQAGDQAVTLLDVRSVLATAQRMVRMNLLDRARLVSALGPTPLVLANEGRLLQVFINLLVNAAQAIPPGNAEANEVRTSAGTDATGSLWIEIADTGSGVPVALRERIFDPFFTTKAAGEGTGLGLYISKRIVQSLGGRIELLPREPHGTVVRISLPAAPQT
jgi:two-component system, cell cycle sensor histidine kinase and response regulator CckA